MADMVTWILQMEAAAADPRLKAMMSEKDDDAITMMVDGMNRIIRAVAAYRDIYANEQLRRMK